MSDEELDLVIRAMDDVIIEQLNEESIFLSYEVAAGTQASSETSQFVDEIEKAKEKLFVEDNGKCRMCNIDGQSLCKDLDHKHWSFLFHHKRSN